MKNNLFDYYIDNIKYPLTKYQTQSEFGARWVYVLYNPITKLTKVGITNNLKERKRSLERQSGCSLYLIIAIELQIDYDESSDVLEKTIHGYFKPKRTHGEWFNLNLKDVIQIKNLFWFIEGEDIIEIERENIKELLK